MNATLKLKPPVAPAALRILRDAPNVDAVILDEDGRAAMLVEFKAQVGAPEARALASQLSAYSSPAIVVAKQTTERARQVLQRAGIGIVDAGGNVHLDLPRAVIHVEAPSRRPRGQANGLRIGGKTAVVIQALLLDHERDWQLTELANRAGASVGTAHRVARFLEERSLLHSEGEGPKRRRRVTDPGALLDLLAEELRDPGVQTLNGYRFEQFEADMPHAVSRSLVDNGVDHAVSGTAAASIIAPFLTAVPAVLVWISAAVPLSHAARDAGAEPADRGGNLVLMQADDDGPLAFAEERSGVHLANEFRIYVDASRDPQRGAEQAEHFRREVIGF